MKRHIYHYSLYILYIFFLLRLILFPDLFIFTFFLFVVFEDFYLMEVSKHLYTSGVDFIIVIHYYTGCPKTSESKTVLNDLS